MALEKTTNSLQVGLYTESTRLKAPDGTYSYALNALMGSKEGDAATLTNENSNTECVLLPDGTTLIGAVLLADGREVLFSTDNEMSYIHLHDTRNCTINLIIRSACLGFKTYRQINALTRIIKSCENVIYFTDKVTSYKSLNINDLDQYLADGFTSQDDANLDPAGEGWNCIKFDHFLSYELGCIESVNVIEGGGSIPYGAHQFTFRYLDEDLNPTNWHTLSYPVFIYSENTGSFLDVIDGEAFGSNSNKSIEFVLTGLDTNYSYIQLAVASSTTGSSVVNESYILEYTPFTGTTANYVYSGFNETLHSATTLSELTVPSISVEAVAAHEQIDNRLFLGNVKTFTEDWALMQKATLMSRVKWFSYTDKEYTQLNASDEFNASKNPNILFTNKTIMRDEVYALGLVFVFDNNSESPVFHIPGRPKDTDYDGVDMSLYDTAGDHLNRGYDTAANFVNQWDSVLLTVRPDAEIISGVNDDIYIGESDVKHIPLSEFVNCPSQSSCGLITGPMRFNVNIINAGADVQVSMPDLTANMQANVRVVRYSSTLEQVFRDDYLHLTNTTPTAVLSGGISVSNTDKIGIVLTISDGTCSYDTLTFLVVDGDSIDLTAVSQIDQTDGSGNEDHDYLTPKTSTRIGCQIER